MKVTRSGVFWTVASAVGPLPLMLGRYLGGKLFGDHDIAGVADWFAEGVGAFVFCFMYLLVASALYSKLDRPCRNQST